MLQRPRGTRDFLPDEMERRKYIENRMRDQARRWGYREVCTPVFEDLELFTLRSGETIVQEMYIFEDKGGRTLALRPEITAPVLRMYVNEAKVSPKPIRWYYFSDCFRYERPQKGRYRQFWQFGIELIGVDSALADAEVIIVADAVLKACDVTFELRIGHLAPMKYLLRDFDQKQQRTAMTYLDKNDFPSLETWLSNIHREDIFESLKELSSSKNVSDVFDITGTIPEKRRIERIIELLDHENIDYSLNFGIARGLDYYTGMVFEGFAENLGAENQVIGGGAYRLAHLFGGDDVASCGFAIGFDRVMVSIGNISIEREASVGIVCSEECRRYASRVADELRAAGVVTKIDLVERGLGAQLSHISKDADFAVIIGEKEREASVISLKNLHTGDQKECSVEDAIHEVKAFGHS